MFTQKKHSNHKKYLTYIHAFTLVELIIVITILAILATVAFISFKNYYDNTRDSVRVTDVRNIFEGLTIFKVKSGNYPLPDNYINISAGSGNILTHQGEVSKGIKQIISLNGKASDPKDNKNYIYASSVNHQRGQLMTYLENGNDIKHLSLITPSYATESNSIDNYRDRPVYIYGDKLGIITDENKVPIQYTTETEVNLLDDEYIEKELITYIGGDVGDGGKSTSTGNVLATQIEASLSGTLSCGSRSYSGYSLSGLSHNQTSNFIKNISISHGTQNLQLYITCINGEYDTQNAIETITSVVCTTSEYVPYNNSCVQNKCSGTIPNHAHSTATSESHLTEWIFSTPGKCSFECNLNYTYDLDSHSCLPNTKVENCTSIPTNSTYNTVNTISQTWDGAQWLPSNISTHDFNSSTSECRFTCNPGYTYDLGNNTCVGNSCTIPATESYNSKTYTIATPGTLLHNNSVTRTGTTSFGTSPNNGTISADFVYSCNAGVLSKSVSNTGGSCGIDYIFNNNYSAPACNYSKYIISGTITNGANAIINGCGTTTVANASGAFQLQNITAGTNCNNIVVTRSGYNCTISTNGPANTQANTTNISGSCCVSNMGQSCSSSYSTYIWNHPHGCQVGCGCYLAVATWAACGSPGIYCPTPGVDGSACYVSYTGTRQCNGSCQ